MSSIDEMWAPNEKSGFIAQFAPVPLEHLKQCNDPTLKGIGNLPLNLQAWDKAAALDFVNRLPIPQPIALSRISAEECETAIRAYSILAANLIHRKFLDSDGGFLVLPFRVASPLWQLHKHVGRPPAL